jgi:Bacteriophage Sf6, terminase small subunit-like
MANRTIRTAIKEAAFLEVLSTNGGNVVRACADTGFSRNAAYQWRADDPEFAAKWDRAVEIGTDALEDEAPRRAHDGTEKPVFQQGKQVGTVREYSDTLMIFMLKARRPDRFKDRVANEFSGRVGTYVVAAPEEDESPEAWQARQHATSEEVR